LGVVCGGRIVHIHSGGLVFCGFSRGGRLVHVHSGGLVFYGFSRGGSGAMGGVLAGEGHDEVPFGFSDFADAESALFDELHVLEWMEGLSVRLESLQADEFGEFLLEGNVHEAPLRVVTRGLGVEVGVLFVEGGLCRKVSNAVARTRR
jgi:hypothetical protein